MTMLEFDAWQRCETVRHLIHWALPDPGRLLDVGGYPGRMRTLIPEHEWVICDPLVDAPGEQMRGSAMQLPVRDQAFDMAVSLDVLEHISPDDRFKVLQEMIRVSRTGLILTFPHRHPLVEAAENHVRETYQKAFQKEHPWLSEHALYPLPDVEEISRYLTSFGGQVAVFDVGEITRWLYLQLVDILMESTPGTLDLAQRLNEIYPEAMYIHEFQPPAYRKIILHLFHSDEPISLHLIETTREEQAESAIQFHSDIIQGLLDSLAKARRVPPPEPVKEPEPEAVEPAQEPKLEPEPEEEIALQPIPEEEPPAESKLEPETVEPQEIPEEPAEEPLEESEAIPKSFPTSDILQEYISRLEFGVQSWEETYAATLNAMTEAHRWRNDLEKRRSFRIYRRIMRFFGHRIDS